MAVPLATLIPLIDPDDDEEEGSRPRLILHSNQKLLLGRNASTRISNKDVSRELLEVEWKDGAVYVKPLKTNHTAKIGKSPLTDETKVDDGDVVSLLRNSYAYQVQYIVRDDNKSAISEHITCPICLDVLVDAVILVPCAHTFCRTCRELSRNDVCPSCRSTVTQQIPNRFADSMIWCLVQDRQLSGDDIQSYLQKTGRTLLNHHSEGRPQRKRKRRKQTLQQLAAEKQVVPLIEK